MYREEYYHDTMPQRSGSGRIILIFLLLLLLAAAGYALLSVATAAPPVVTRDHAVITHGEEAEAVRQACQQRGPTQFWQSRDPARQNEFWQVCQLGDDYFGVQLIRCVKGIWYEATAFIPGASQFQAGSWSRIVEYLSGKATVAQTHPSEMCRPGG